MYSAKNQNVILAIFWFSWSVRIMPFKDWRTYITEEKRMIIMKSNKNKDQIKTRTFKVKTGN